MLPELTCWLPLFGAPTCKLICTMVQQLNEGIPQPVGIVKLHKSVQAGMWITEGAMAGELDPFRLKLLAHEYLLHVAVIRLTLLDREFAQDAREWFDVIFGAFSASELAKPFPPEHISAIRSEYMRLVERSEEQASMALKRPK